MIIRIDAFVLAVTLTQSLAPPLPEADMAFICTGRRGDIGCTLSTRPVRSISLDATVIYVYIVERERGSQERARERYILRGVSCRAYIKTPYNAAHKSHPSISGRVSAAPMPPPTPFPVTSSAPVSCGSLFGSRMSSVIKKNMSCGKRFLFFNGFDMSEEL